MSTESQMKPPKTMKKAENAVNRLKLMINRQNDCKDTQNYHRGKKGYKET